MKKGLFILLALCVSGLAIAQDVEEPQTEEPQTEDSVKIKGVHPYKTEENAKGIAEEIAHWSLIPHIGFSAFDGDFTEEMRTRVAVPALGFGVEYNFTPIWNVGVEYMYDMYTVVGDKSLVDADGNRLNADTLLSGHMHKAGAYLSFDILNLFLPRVNKKIVSLFPYFGAGGAWYKRYKYHKDDMYYDAEKGIGVNPTHGRGNTANYINDDGKVGPDYDTDYRLVGYIQAGASLDFNLNRTLALGLRANYTYFTRDYVDGRGYWKHTVYTAASKNNDGIFDVTMYMRFKLEAVSKSHPRNMPSFDKFDEWVEDTNVEEPCHDTIIYFRHDSIIIREVKQSFHKEVFNVYFDNDKAIIRQDGLVTIQEVADRMESNKDLYAVVIGYCDNTGGNGHNFKLGDKRAFNVIDELEQEYAIPADHLYGKGSGKLVGRRSTKSYGPNRRAAIHLVDEETFELMKMQLEDNSETRDINKVNTYENSRPIPVINLQEIEEEVPQDSVKEKTKTIPLTESAQKAKVNPYKQRTHNVIVAEKDMTLSNLARKYYDNTFCWVYIYAANRDKIDSPNVIPEGTELVIPELTEKELNITMKECLRIYSMVAHQKEK